MLYYDLMVKLAVADTSSLFNLTAEIHKKEFQEHLVGKISEKYPEFDPSQNLHETLIDAYLLHFYKEMDTKSAMKSDIYKKMLGKEKTEKKIEDMGPLESMRQIMKKEHQFDVEKAKSRMNKILGNNVKNQILESKKEKSLDVDDYGDDNEKGKILTKRLFDI